MAFPLDASKGRAFAIRFSALPGVGVIVDRGLEALDPVGLNGVTVLGANLRGVVSPARP